MRFCRKIEISPWFAAGLGLLVCLDPAALCLPFLLAAALHELGHLLCLRLCHVPVTKLRIGAMGAELETPVRTAWQELCCAAAGPAINLLTVVLFWRTAPKLAVLSGLLGLVNLLPVYPLDGGRMLYILLPRMAPFLSTAASVALLAVGAVLTVKLHTGLWPLLLLGVLLGKIAVCRIQEEKLIANRAAGLYNSGRKQKPR